MGWIVCSNLWNCYKLSGAKAIYSNPRK